MRQKILRELRRQVLITTVVVIGIGVYALATGVPTATILERGPAVVGVLFGIAVVAGIALPVFLSDD